MCATGPLWARTGGASEGGSGPSCHAFMLGKCHISVSAKVLR
jgi:hypothetical protein